jgi:hypothetical protein
LLPLGRTILIDMLLPFRPLGMVRFSMSAGGIATGVAA